MEGGEIDGAGLKGLGNAVKWLNISKPLSVGIVGRPREEKAGDGGMDDSGEGVIENEYGDSGARERSELNGEGSQVDAAEWRLFATRDSSSPSSSSLRLPLSTVGCDTLSGSSPMSCL